MNAGMTLPLDITAVQVVKTELPRQGDWTITGESTRECPRGRKCGREMTEWHGRDEGITLRHLPMSQYETRPSSWQPRRKEG
jgi:transposase